jgi:GAF domain-containing protein
MDEPSAISHPTKQDAAESSDEKSFAKLSDLVSRLARIGVLEQGLLEILAAVIELLGADKGNVQLLDRERGLLTIVAHWGFDQEFLNRFKAISSLDDTACGRALRLRRPIFIEDTETDAGYTPYRSAARAAGYRAVISAPIMGSDGRPLGIISSHFTSIHQPTDHEKRLLNLYVRQAADFIERCRRGDSRAPSFANRR